MDGRKQSTTIQNFLTKNEIGNEENNRSKNITLAKLRAVKLQSYWKRICEDEKRSKQRNAQLLRDLDRMEANMASLEARREKLRHMKQNYFDYIERTYPKWLELVQQKKHEYIQEQQQKHEQQYQQQHQQQFQQQQYEQQQRFQQQQQQVQQQQYFSSSQARRQEYGQSPGSQQSKRQEETLPKQQEAFLTQHQYDDTRDLYENDRDEESPPPLPSQPPPTVPFSEPEREYTNLRDIRRDNPNQVTPQPQSVTVHMPSAQGDAVSPSKSGRPGSGRRSEQPNQNWMAAERDASIHSLSFSEETDVQPPAIQSVTVRQKTEPPKPVVQTMEPVSDEDVSDFGDEPDLPSGADGDRVDIVKPPSPVQAVVEEHDDDDEDDTDRTPSIVHPEISTSGLFRLLKFVEEELLNALALENFYRTRNPDEATKKDIIYKANNENSSLQSLDGELVSMVILQQLTLVVRRLPGGCMLSDTLLVRGSHSSTNEQIRSNLHRDAQTLWDKLMEHFILLVKNRVMGTREVAHVFVPCLVHAGSENQAKAVSVIEDIIENAIEKVDGKSSPVPQDSLTVDTARSSQQGAGIYMNINLSVPPLKFGSLVDSKPFSDEESSMITQSMNTDVQKIPLNETDAYKNLISGTRPAVRTMSHDDTDNSDNELEKQIASTLSPRSHGSKPHSDPHNDVPFSAPKDASHDLSHDNEPQSELSSPSAAPVYVPTGVEQSTAKSILGSTGGSSQQRKIAGMISSDLDTDTEVDLDHMVQKKEDDDDDFYDFYG
ncbi:uncharacterized protein LOC132718621 isoform X3 [Ruditapes philippinarum]|uniref:uncharacterized protein LOC132718621 isoform X3 n=1 Tax=Ruditapes philippinarum TaxID=129788 RepID=UPI00295AF88C|nr:uncharacterized protein LOC132718621 isoform X3 [Ruditapes philippinarum]